ncbi:hypothetical protein [Buchnera aphidicola]|uniref:hypothetical protein n=1 Tax=Buchnera aphidicola TaxID=9 RepID=UPI003D18DFBA
MYIITLLKQAIKKKIIHPIDFYFAINIVTTKEPEIILAAVCISYTTRFGNICLPISHIEKKKFFLKTIYYLSINYGIQLEILVIGKKHY